MVLISVIRSSNEPASASGWPGAEQCADGSVAAAVCQVGADGGQDAGGQASPGQGWYGPAAPVDVEGEHACRQDEPIDGEGHESSGRPSLAVGVNEFVSVAVGDDGGHRSHRCYG